MAPFQIGWALLQSLGVIIRRRPAVVLGMGGFVSGPGGVAAWLTRRPLVIHEQNAAAGLTNRLLARLARVVLQAFPGSFNSDVGAETVGNPVREDIAAIEAPAPRYAERRGPLRLLVLGGSQGALALNRTVPAALALLGTADRPVGAPPVRRAHARGRTGRPMPDMASMSNCCRSSRTWPQAYAWADLVVCRAGALTVAELCAAGLPALFVPYPAAVDDHQTANAGPMAAPVLPQSSRKRTSHLSVSRTCCATGCSLATSLPASRRESARAGHARFARAHYRALACSKRGSRHDQDACAAFTACTSSVSAVPACPASPR